MRTKRLVMRFFPILLVGTVFLVGVIAIQKLFMQVPYREMLVITGEPVFVVSFDAKRRRVMGVELPPDILLRGGYGYGTYALQSLVALDAIDKKGGSLLQGSISSALGLPVSGVVFDDEATHGRSLSVATLRRIFSLRPKHSTLGAIRWMRLVRIVSTLEEDALGVVSIAQAFETVTQADGSESFRLDERRIDALLGNDFFDVDIREESFSLAVYNTTDVPSVGEGFARELSRIGVKLVFVGNGTPLLPTCRLSGGKNVERAHTTMFIRRIYGCDWRTDEAKTQETGADIVLEIGEKEATRFQ